MKTLVLQIMTFLFLMTYFSGIAQEEETTLNSELKLNIPLSLAGYVEGSYEHILTDESAIGISLGAKYEDDFYFNYAVIPYYRFYFGRKRAAGFFIEGNGAFYSQKDNSDSIANEEEINEIGLGLGMAIGMKIMTKKGWVFEIFGGAGRNFSNTDLIDSGYPRLGLNLGKRF